MGFRTLYDGLRKTEGTCEEARADVADLVTLVSVPELATSLYACYQAAGILKPVLKATCKEVQQMVASGRLQQTPRQVESPHSMRRFMEHTARTFAAHQHAGDADCRRWAAAAARLHPDDPEGSRLLDLVVRILNASDQRVRDFVRTTLQWTCTQFSARGCPVLPYR